MAGQPPASEPVQSRAPHDFEDIYVSGSAPWDIGRPQPAFTRLAEAGGLVGRVLDVGCGTGEHALLAASLGHDAVGVDIAPRAIELAREKAQARDLSARFLVADALRLPALREQFDTVLDCGLFHCFDDDDRARFVDSLGSAVRTGGHYHMLCFSERQPGNWGPRRVTQSEIHASFISGWTIDPIQPTVLEITIDPAGAQAWLVDAVRT